MTSAAVDTQPGALAALVRRRLKEIKRSAADLADAIDLPHPFVDDLLDGTRPPPRPGRSDIYPKMTAFLRLARNQVIAVAQAERDAPGRARDPGAAAGTRELLLALCEPKTARLLERRARRDGAVALTDLCQRLLEVAQGTVLRLLDDQVALRLAAAERSISYAEMRLRVIEFLDTTVYTVGEADVNAYLRPCIGQWDVDLDTGVLRVVLRSHPPRGRRSKPLRSSGAA